MNIEINGETRSVDAMNLRALLFELGLKPHALLIEHNGVALRTAEWDSCTLNEGDRIEFIRIVAGG